MKTEIYKRDCYKGEGLIDRDLTLFS